jgi:asparagine synthase (glutamine-hydrolysing)
MCGIIGFIGNYKSFGLEDLKLMNNQIVHRGPDDEGYYIDKINYVALAHRRLSILDLSESGHQPMYSKSKRFIIVYNGEVYNFEEIKVELDSKLKVEWKGHSDTEVILEAIEFYGIEEALKKFNGMFAFTLYDTTKRELYFARDRFGKKPLYYSHQNGVFVFASELKALVKHPQIAKNVSREALNLYFKLGYIPAPYSIYENIFKLGASTYAKLKLENNELTFFNYYKIDEYNLRASNESDAVETLDNLLEDSVKKRMVSDVEIGSFLSAGIDSSIVTAYMQKNSSSNINTYTVGFDVDDYNEAPRAKEIAKHLGTNHHEHYLTQKDVMDVIPSLANIYDEPFSDFSSLPSVLITKYASKKVKVMLSGDGGDELFGGYTRYTLAKKSWSKINSSSINKLLFKIGSKVPISTFDNQIIGKMLSKYTNRKGFVGDKIAKFFESVSLEEGFLTSSYLLNSPWKNNQIVRDCKNSNFIEDIIDNIESLNLNQFEQMMCFDRKLYLTDNNLVKIDRASMANSLEVRSPLLDYRILEFSNSLDTSLKINKNNGKYILKKVLNKYIPEKLMDMPKMGFSVPMGDWLRNDLKDWAYELLVYGKNNYNYLLDFDLIFKFWEEHQNMKRNFPQQLWSVVVFIEWAKNEKI